MTRSASAKPAESLLPTPSGYIQKATLPLQSLLFLLPLMVAYEVGVSCLTTAARSGQEQQIIAFSKMQQFCNLCGASGPHMPTAVLTVILLGWHIARKDRWTLDFSTVGGMVVESAVLGLPLLLLAFMVNKYFPLIGLQAVPLEQGSLLDRLIMDIGAGVYEEFLFRLILFTLMTVLLKDILGCDDKLALPLMVAGSGVIFSLYHYLSPTEHFFFRTFAFRSLAGMYFGLIFILRGFGVTAGSHCAYDIIITIF